MADKTDMAEMQRELDDLSTKSDHLAAEYDHADGRFRDALYAAGMDWTKVRKDLIETRRNVWMRLRWARYHEEMQRYAMGMREYRPLSPDCRTCEEERRRESGEQR